MEKEVVIWYDEANEITPQQWANLRLLLYDRGLIRANHEVWRVCSNCGNWIDARMSLTCDRCGFENDI